MKLMQNINQALIYMTECALATVEHLEGLSRAPKSQLERARSIAETGLGNCRMFVSESDARLAGCPRVERRLAEWKKQ